MGALKIRLPTKYGKVLLTCESLYDSKIKALTKAEKFKDKNEEKVYAPGTILIPQNRGDGLTHAFYENIYDAVRSRLHALYGYNDKKKGEVTRLQNICAVLDSLTKSLGRTGELTPAKVGAITRKLNTVSVHLSAARNENKRRAAEKLANARGLRDKLGRKNPSASFAKFSKAEDLLVERLAQISEIAPHINVQLWVLEAERARSRQVIETVLNRISSPMMLLRQHKSLKAWGACVSYQLRRSTRELAALRVSPFVKSGELAAKEFTAAASSLDKASTDMLYQGLMHTVADVVAGAIHDFGILVWRDAFEDERTNLSLAEKFEMKEHALRAGARLCRLLYAAANQQDNDKSVPRTLHCDSGFLWQACVNDILPAIREGNISRAYLYLDRAMNVAFV